MRAFWLLLMALGASHASAADDFKIIKLEQDVRNLERQVQVLSRQVDELRSHSARSGERRIAPRTSTPLLPSSSAWLSAANWERVQSGMSELDVIRLLGPPSSMRVEDEARVLLYAMEIGTDGFLSGSVMLKERQVAAVEKPVLK
ncbi:MAG: hypothetical protein ACREV5_22830 [Steroidobacter sp.]